MANSKQKIKKFSDNKLFWMSVLALLLSIGTAVVLAFYIQVTLYNDRLIGESEMKFQSEMWQFKFCYENDIKPCNIETIQEYNRRNYTE